MILSLKPQLNPSLLHEPEAQVADCQEAHQCRQSQNRSGIARERRFHGLVDYHVDHVSRHRNDTLPKARAPGGLCLTVQRRER